MGETTSWQAARESGRIGTGNWEAWSEDISAIEHASLKWKEKLEGVNKPWLCWCLDDDWSILQQKLIKGIGWTPIVGTDSNIKEPTILDGSIHIDFNEDLKLPTMWMHFPIEFAHLFVDKLAFWHSDLLCSEAAMKEYAYIFENLPDGEIAAVKHLHGWFGLKERHKNHYGELIACTTKSASKSQFVNGCGWWRNINEHPNYKKEVVGGNKVYYEHGKGIWIWEKHFGGKITSLKVNEHDGHASARVNGKPELASKADELREYANLSDITKALNIEHLYTGDKS
jgi:hypothetical protein